MNLPQDIKSLKNIKLNIGCGFDKIKGYVNIDKIAACNPDIIMDLEKPWPFENDSVTEIQASHVLEHVGQLTEDFLNIMKEMYRVCQHDAIVHIQVPHHNHWTFHSDPTHVRKILPEMFLLFDKKENEFHIKNKHANTPLGIYCDVDFVADQVTPHYDEPWGTRIQNNLITAYDLQFAAAHYTNVIVQWDLKLKIRKNFKPNL